MNLVINNHESLKHLHRLEIPKAERPRTQNPFHFPLPSIFIRNLFNMREITKKGFEFVESSHRYYFDGKPMTGVTTVLGVIAKPALINWAAKMASEYMESKGLLAFGDGQEFNTEKFKQICDDAKKAHTQKRDKAAEQGTDVHAVCEEIIKDVIENSGGMIRSGKNNNKQVQHFLEWAIKNKVKFLESEKRVYDKDLFLAGTADLVCEIDGKKYIGDIKTSSSIYGIEPFAQCAAYAKMLDYDLDGTIIINLKKDGSFDEEKDIYYRYNLETDWKFFESALSIYRLQATWQKPNYQSNKKTITI